MVSSAFFAAPREIGEDLKLEDGTPWFLMAPCQISYTKGSRVAP